MKPVEVMRAVIDALEDLGIPYVVVGSFSSNLYGRPRSTEDGDFVVQVDEAAVKALVTRLGPAFRLEPQMGFETVTGSHRYLLTLTSSPFKVELFLLQDEEYHRTRFARRVRVDLVGRQAWVPTVEDVIVTKLRWSRQGHRAKDIEDVTNVLKVQFREGTSLDWGYIHRWCDQHGTRALLDEIRQSIPPL